jgi:Mce-associated membrane protein
VTGDRSVRVAAVLGAAVLLLLVGAVAQGYQFWEGRSTARAAGAAIDAAAESVPRLLSYDANSIDAAAAVIDEVSTGDFRNQFSQLFNTTVKPAALAQNASSKATVVARSEVSAASDKVVALLFINQSTVSRKLPGERVDTIEARVTMERVDGRWLVSGMDQM